MNFTQTLIAESKRLSRDISVLAVCILGPLLYFFLYPSPYRADVIKPQKIVIIDQDQSSLSAKLSFLATASPDLILHSYSGSLLEAQGMLERGEVYGILYIPKGFERDAYLQSAPQLSFLANSSYFLIYGSIINALHQSTESLNPLIHEKQKLYFHLDAPKDLLTLQANPLFNPSMGYINYAIAAVFVVILHQMLLVGMGAFGASYSGQAPLHWILLSRLLLFGGLCLALFAFYFGFGFSYYGIHHHASMRDFWLLSSALIFAIVAFGNFFALIVHKPYQATIFILLSSLPLVFLLGFIWPSFAIPPSINTFVQFIPIFHGVNALLRLNEMGASFHAISPYFFHLLALGLFYTLLCYPAHRIKDRLCTRR